MRSCGGVGRDGSPRVWSDRRARVKWNPLIDDGPGFPPGSSLSSSQLGLAWLRLSQLHQVDVPTIAQLNLECNRDFMDDGLQATDRRR